MSSFELNDIKIISIEKDEEHLLSIENNHQTNKLIRYHVKYELGRLKDDVTFKGSDNLSDYKIKQRVLDHCKDRYS